MCGTRMTHALLKMIESLICILTLGYIYPDWLLPQNLIPNKQPLQTKSQDTIEKPDTVENNQDTTESK